MSEHVTNPKVVVYGDFQRHKCVSKAARSSAHKSPLRKLAEERRRTKDRSDRR